MRIGVVAFLASLLALQSGCVETSLPSPNSDKGHLFVDLEDGLAVGWESQILVMGPSTGGEHCDEQRGCYHDHRSVQMEDVVSTDTSVVEVTDFSTVEYGEVEAIRVDLEVVGAGEAALEFSFSVEGYSPAEDEEEDPYDEEGRLVDSFGVDARDVSSVELVRLLDGVEPLGPYGSCPESTNGTYLMESLDSYKIAVQMKKLDEEGNLLRGSGVFPFDISPAEAVELEDDDEASHLISIHPTEFGTVTLTPQVDGEPFEISFESAANVTNMNVGAYALNVEGQRAHLATELIAESLYEIEATPALPDDAPLCGGTISSSVTSMTPAICDVVGEMENTGNAAVAGFYFGECRLQVTLHGAGGGQGLVGEVIYPVEVDW